MKYALWIRSTPNVGMHFYSVYETKEQAELAMESYGGYAEYKIVDLGSVKSLVISNGIGWNDPPPTELHLW